MKKILSGVTVILCLAIGCQKYDDSQIKKDISDLQEQVASLKAWCESSQAAIDAVDALKNAVKIQRYHLRRVFFRRPWQRL